MPYGSTLYIPQTNFSWLLNQSHTKKKKSLSLNKENGPAGRKSNRLGKNKRGDSKVESNDRPEIPDRGKTSDIPGISSGLTQSNSDLTQNTQSNSD